ncbi:MAG: endonuclease MutS2 [Candidatus Cloacimonetes bacterium]|nr:endonuclease MutS2 [Candidatus Cloacimonadota bacterium]
MTENFDWGETARQLEYDKILQLLAGACHSSSGSDIAIELTPLTDADEIRQRLDLISELKELLAEGFSVDFSRVNNCEHLLVKFEHSAYSFEEFTLIYNNMAVCCKLRENDEELEEFPLILKKALSITAYPDFTTRYEAIFTPEGEVMDSASPELAHIRKRRRQLRVSINKTLEKTITENASKLSDSVITLRDNRYVVPVKEGHASSFGGIMHGRSASKATVFIQPANAVGMNNELIALRDDEKEEIYRIFTNFTAQILIEAETLLSSFELLPELDFYFASARYAREIQAAPPQITRESHITLLKARHPLLIHTLGSVSNVIPFDIELGLGKRILVLSGPNTGGKTVLLKSIGLLTMMAMSGLHIPADVASEIGLFPSVFVDIGDHQSLEDSLSTFSSHLRHIDAMLRNSKENTLVLIDEIGSATDPEQGSALAQAVIEKLVELKPVGVITTHYMSVKVLAENHAICENAAMQFDTQTHTPTYRIMYGLPGNSFAIETAERLGMDSDVILRAKELSGCQNTELTDLISKMSTYRKELARAKYDYELKTRLLEQKAEDYQKRVETLEQETKSIKKEVSLKARDYLIRMQNEISEEIEQIKKEDKETRKNALRKTSEKIYATQKELSEEITTSGEWIPLTKPQLDMEVWVPEFETTGTVVSTDGSKVQVNVGGFMFTTEYKKLYTNKSVISKKKGKKTITSSPAPVRTARMELKLLGFTFDEARPEIEAFLDEALLAGLDLVRIVHGKGSGALRSKVRAYLRRHPRIKEFYSPADSAGGSGVTVANLRDK